MNILYFASLKESLNLSSEKIILTDNTTITQLRTQLINKYGKHNFPNNTICAVNQEIANDAVIIKKTDEVAFYPPVTGG